jgi:hypothetical protein
VLIASGAAPPKRLRMDLAAPTSQLVTYALDQTVSGPRMNTQNTALQTQLSEAVDGTGTSGKAKISYVYVDVSTPGATPDEAAAVMAALLGTGVHITVTDRNQIVDQSVEQTLPGLPELLSLTKQLAPLPKGFRPPMPAEAVGVGAQWRTKTGLLIAGISTQATTLYTLQSLQDNQIHLSAKFTEHANFAPRQLPGLSTGANVKAIVVGSGSGSIIVDPSQPAPISVSEQVGLQVAVHGQEGSKARSDTYTLTGTAHESAVTPS